MKTPIRYILILLLSLALSNFSSQLSIAFAQGTAFTYQGRLNVNGAVATGLYDFRFRLDADPQGDTILDTVLTNAIPVTNGLFTTTINFGAGWFNGSNCWLEVDVRTNNPGNTLTYTSLTPYQSLTPTPYAVFANTASNVSGTVSAVQLSGPIANGNLPANPIFSGTVTASSLSGNGANLTSLNANNLASGTIPLAQLPSEVVTNYASGATLSNLTLNGELILPDYTLGGPVVILTGYSPLLYADNYENFFSGPSAGNLSVSGGANTANGYEALSLNQSGFYNTAIGWTALFYNSSGPYNTAVGAQVLYNNLEGSANTAVGIAVLANNQIGNNNTAVGSFALEQLGLAGYSSEDGGGTNNIALGYAAGYNFTNDESGNIDIGNRGQANENNTIRIGTPGVQTNTFIAGVINGNGGGLTNLTVSAAQLSGSGNYNVFVGPSGNTTTSGPFNTAIGAAALAANTSGSANTAIGDVALSSNTNGFYNTAIGAAALAANTSGSFNTAVGVEALNDDVSGSNNVALGYLAGVNITTGSANIDIGNVGSSTDTNIIRIGSGQTQTFIAGVIHGNGGGLTNLNASQISSGTIPLAYVSGALPSSTTYTVGGNQGGGFGSPVFLITNVNTSANASPALRVVGYGDTGNGVLSVSSQGTGLLAQFGNATSFVSSLDTNGNWTATTFSPSSDRNVKGNFTPVSAQAMLAKVAALPISRWSFTNSPGVPHVGPMAQDFYHAFNIGADDKHIATVDESGVALAAIQGLNQKLNEKDAEIQTLKQQNDSLAERLNELEATVKQLAAVK